MARVQSQTWKTVLNVALIVLVITLIIAGIFSGYLVWYFGIVILLLAMAGGALMFRKLGPPSR